MSTFTAVDLAGQMVDVKQCHTGVQSQYVEYSFSATLTVSSVIKLVRVHNGTLVEKIDLAGLAGDGSLTVNVGTSATPSGMMGATSLSAAGSGASNLVLMPFKVSLSDDAVPQHVWIELKTQANGTSFSAAGGKLKCRVQYRNDI